MDTFAFLLHFATILVVFDSQTSGYDIDYSLECNPGYRLASFRRSPSINNVIGALTVECELIEPSPELVSHRLQLYKELFKYRSSSQ